MKIDSIAIHNFKCFNGPCRIAGLAEEHTSDKRIILFGGLNGAGKTTIFEALLLCLYGQKNKTLWPSKGARREDYQHYIYAVTNLAAVMQSLRPQMSIEVTLKDIELGGFPKCLHVKRTWIIDAPTRTIWDETLEITDEKGQRFDFVSQDDWEEFIDELIPYDVSQFFFFDGEKIQDFVKDEDKAFAESLEKILGITLYNKLKDDLEEVRRRILREFKKNKDIRRQSSEIEAEIEAKESEIDENSERVDQIINGIRAIEDRIMEIDIETKRITRVKAASLEEAENEKEHLLQEKGGIEEKLFEAIQDDLPFVMLTPLCEELIEQLEKEKNLQSYFITQKTLQPKIERITKRVFEESDNTKKLSEELVRHYSHKLSRILEEILAEKPPDLFGNAFETLHNLSAAEIDTIQHKVQSTKGIVGALSRQLSRLQEIEPRLRHIQQAEQRADDPEAMKLYEERGKLNEQIALKKQEIDSLRAENNRKQAEITSLKSRRTELEKKAQKTAKMHQQIEYCKKISAALDDFSHNLRVQKVKQLQDYTLSMWQILAHKKDHVAQIVINPDSQFSIDLFNAEGKKIDKTKLSAGEKEILAISLISALSQLTERALPIIIDTPLGRLDTLHRINIAKGYFPNASHQVILLSTNTELVGEEYKAIRPFIGKHFIIQKDAKTKTSTVTEGYFDGVWQNV
jgi:DNA sulfur modification protein DndD